jgi:hypothetical protein
MPAKRETLAPRRRFDAHPAITGVAVDVDGGEFLGKISDP